MGVNYNRLFEELEKRGISKTQLRDATKMSTSTLAKLSSHRPVTLEVLERVCKHLDLTPNEVFEFDDSDIQKPRRTKSD